MDEESKKTLLRIEQNDDSFTTLWIGHAYSSIYNDDDDDRRNWGVETADGQGQWRGFEDLVEEFEHLEIYAQTIDSKEIAFVLDQSPQCWDVNEVCKA